MTTAQDELRAAVLGNNYEGVEQALLKGANVKAGDEKGETVLHVAMRIGAATNVIQLLDAGADANQPDSEGVTPFMAAVCATKFANATFSLDYDANVNFQPTPQSLPPLYRAMVFDTINGTVSRTEYMLKHGGNIDAVVVCDSGKHLSLIEFALKCDEDAGKDTFAKLIQNYLSRDIRAEFNAAVARKSKHDTITAVISSRVQADGTRFKMGRR